MIPNRRLLALQADLPTPGGNAEWPACCALPFGASLSPIAFSTLKKCPDSTPAPRSLPGGDDGLAGVARPAALPPGGAGWLDAADLGH